MNLSKPLPLVTIVICTYQRPHILPRAIEAALAQTNKNYLIHIFDDCSNDSTEDVVKDFQSKSDIEIRYTKQPKNLGVVGNCASAVEQIETKYYCLTADDDFMLPNFVEVHLSAFEQNPHIGTSISGVLSCFNDGEIAQVPASPGCYPKLEAAIYLFFQPVFVGAMMFKSEIFNITQGVKSQVGDIYDLDLLYRYALNAPIYVSEEFTMFHHKHDNSISYKYEKAKLAENFSCRKKLFYSLKQEMAKFSDADTQRVLKWYTISAGIIFSMYADQVFQEKNFDMLNKLKNIATEELIGSERCKLFKKRLLLERVRSFGKFRMISRFIDKKIAKASNFHLSEKIPYPALPITNAPPERSDVLTAKRILKTAKL